MDEIGTVFLVLFLMLALSHLFAAVFKRLKLPELVGYIVAGIVIVNLTSASPALAGLLQLDNPSVMDPITFISELGIVFLLFIIGSHVKMGELAAIGKPALSASVIGIILPFIGGFAVGMAFLGNMNAAIMVGTAIFAMSASVATLILKSLGIDDAEESKLIIGVAIFSDIICLILLAINASVVSAESDGGPLWLNIAIILAFIAMVFVFISRYQHYVIKKDRIKKHLGLDDILQAHDPYIVGVVSCIGFAAISYLVGLSGIVGAFLAGMYMGEYVSHLNKTREEKVTVEFDGISDLFVPVFFCAVGFKLDFGMMSADALIIAGVLFVIAVVLKYLGGYIGCRIAGIARPLAELVSSCMIARGEIAIIVASMAYGLGLFNVDMFAGVIIMAVLTQVAAPAVITRAYERMTGGSLPGKDADQISNT